MNRIAGQKILIKTGTKFFAGVTDVDLSGSLKYEESLIKEDDGVPLKEKVANEEKMNISGLICVGETGEATTHIDWSGIRAAYRAGVPVPFIYGMGVTGKPEISGNLLILSYSEKSGSSGKATYSLECEVVQDNDLTYGVTPT